MSKKVSQTAGKVIRLLKKKGGVTKAQIVKAVPEAKPLYINALLYVILEQKGIKVKRTHGPDGKVVYSVAA